MPKRNAVVNPNLGIYLNRPDISIPPRGLKDCLNVRIRNGKIVRDNMGWSRFHDINLDNQPVTLIDNFFFSDGDQKLVFGTIRDLYEFVESTETVRYINPRYETGTVDVTNGSAVVTGTGTSWSSNLKAGDFIHVGATAQRDPAAAWFEIESVDSDTQITLTADYDDATAAAQAYTARKTFTGDMRDWWDTETFLRAGPSPFKDKWFATNGIDDMVEWDGTSDQVTLLDSSGFKCRNLALYKNMMIYGRVIVSGEERPTSIKNSAIGEPTNVSGAEAGENAVHDGVDQIVALLPIGDNLVIYSERTIVLAQFVGPPLNFVFRIAVSGIGSIAGRAIADFGDFHKFIGPDSQYRFDGISIDEIGRHVWREVIRQQRPQARDLFQAHFDEESGEVVWIAPLTTDPGDPETAPPTKAFTEHYLEEVRERDPTPYAIREIAATATGFFERLATLTWEDLTDAWQQQNFKWNDRFFHAAFPLNLFGDANGDIFVLNTQDSHDGADITSFAQFPRRPIGDVKRKGIVKRIYPFTEKLTTSPSDLDVTLYTADQVDTELENKGTSPFDMTHSTSRHFVSPRKSGRYAAVRFGNTGRGKPFALTGYDIESVPGGER